MLQTKDTDWLKGLFFKDWPIHCLLKTHFIAKDTHRLKERGWKKIFHANGTQKEAGAATVISDKIDFKTKSLTKDKEGH